jgi:hypothetical protein
MWKMINEKQSRSNLNFYLSLYFIASLRFLLAHAKGALDYPNGTCDREGWLGRLALETKRQPRRSRTRVGFSCEARCALSGDLVSRPKVNSPPIVAPKYPVNRAAPFWNCPDFTIFEG